MSSPRNIFLYDTETSGLRPEEGAEIVQIAATAINFWDFKPHHAGNFSILLKPNKPEKASQKAIEVIGLDLWNKAINEGVDHKVGLITFCEWVNNLNDQNKDFTKPYMAGHNLLFDYNFTVSELKEYKIISHAGEAPFQEKIIDTWSLAWSLFEGDKTVNNIGLDNLLQLLKIQRSGNVHDAVEDVKLNAVLLERFMKFFRECRKRMSTSK